MSLPHVLLGMLAEPASGYDLKQYFSQSVRHFWSAELSQIYPALSKLEKQGLLTSQTQPSEKGPPRKIYSRTRAGRDSLREWLADGPIVRSERVAYLTQLFFLDEIPNAGRIRFFENLRDDFQAHQEELLAVEKNWAAQDPNYPDQLSDAELVKQMTLVLGIRKYGVIRDWCQECLDRLKRRR